MDAKTEQERRMKKNMVISPKQQPASKTGFYACNHKNRDEIAKHTQGFDGVIEVLPSFAAPPPKAYMTGTVNEFTGG